MSILIPKPINPQLVTGLDLGESHIGWLNYINANTVSSLADPTHLGYLYDNMTSLFWNAGVGTVDLDIAFTEVTPINWVGVANGNWQSAGTAIEVYVSGILKGEISGLRDGDPFMWVFDEVDSASITIRFISTGNLLVGEAGVGETIKLPCLPNVGMSLGKFNNNDKVFSKRTEDDLLAGSSLVRRARMTSATYGTVPINWLRLYWVPFSNEWKGKLVWFIWDSVGAPFDVSFGHWESNKVSYDRSTYSTLSITISGDAR